MSTAKTPKQPLSIYSVMLIISAILMLAACILMTVEMYRYGSPWEDSGLRSAMTVGPKPLLGVPVESIGSYTRALS
jgi:hypothetical protein